MKEYQYKIIKILFMSYGITHLIVFKIQISTNKMNMNIEDNNCLLDSAGFFDSMI